LSAVIYFAHNWSELQPANPAVAETEEKN